MFCQKTSTKPDQGNPLKTPESPTYISVQWNF